MDPIGLALATLATTLAATLMAATGVVVPVSADGDGGSDARSGAVAPRTRDRCTAGRVALTFDDGPSPTVTPGIVSVLRERHVPATFFMVGSRVAQYPETARLVADAGFTIGNHSYAHDDLTSLSQREVRSSLRRTRSALRDAGVDRVSPLVRPPYGATDARVEHTLTAADAVLALWNVDSRDWDGLDPREIRRSTVAQVVERGRDDSVVLHHDGVANSAATLAALPSEIRRLRGEGFCLVALPPTGLE